MSGEGEKGASPAGLNDDGKSAAEPVDMAHLARYTLGDQALEREVLELFCSQSVTQLERLRTASSDKEWSDIAHSLKGSARSVGAWRMARAAERAEALQFDSPAGERAAYVDELDASLKEADAYIRSVFAARGA
ncbi:MAG: Hpt domain-containing protein [Methyloceanibacter sp.]|uniref:Hpt domain-containing protein n=1 Tax=Methyloceanibacter sp. TaxID=1965321 RepID=UPI001E13074E|nr:Hpt domain-containing protein [Methyloceanibacter sp.]MCB1442166.1 Hpt domain-containing protein [Methyloceanibacter sp.]